MNKQQNLKLKLDILKIKEKNKRLRSGLSPRDYSSYNHHEIFGGRKDSNVSFANKSERGNHFEDF